MRFSFTKRDSWVTNGTLALHFTADDNIKYYSRPLDTSYVDKEYNNGDIEYAMGNGKIIFYDKGKNEVGSFSAGEEEIIKFYY